MSVQKLTERGTSRVVLSTVVKPHNVFGRTYLRAILPFHRIGVRTILANALAADRI